MAIPRISENVGFLSVVLLCYPWGPKSIGQDIVAGIGRVKVRFSSGHVPWRTTTCVTQYRQNSRILSDSSRRGDRPCPRSWSPLSFAAFRFEPSKSAQPLSHGTNALATAAPAGLAGLRLVDLVNRGCGASTGSTRLGDAPAVGLAALHVSAVDGASLPFVRHDDGLGQVRGHVIRVAANAAGVPGGWRPCG